MVWPILRAAGSSTVPLRPVTRGAHASVIGVTAAQETDPLVALTCIFPVELPGIETSAEITVTCGYAEFECAKRRGSTVTDLRIRERC